MKYNSILKYSCCIYGCIIILTIQGILSYIGYMLQLNSEINSINNSINEINSDIINRFLGVIELSQHNIDRTNAFIEINGKFVSQSDFESINSFNSLPIRNSIEHYYWNPIIYPFEFDEYIEFGRNNIFENFTITTFENNSITQLNANSSDFFIPISVFAPPFPIPSIFGFDYLFPGISFFILESNFTTNHTITRRTQMVATDDTSFCVQLVKPTLTSNGTYLGYTLGIIRVINAFEETLDSSIINRDNIQFLIFDNSQLAIQSNTSLLYKPNNTEFNSIFSPTDINLPIFSKNTTFTILNREWTLQLLFSGSFIQTSFLPIIILLILIFGFIILDFFCCGFFYISILIHNNKIHKDKQEIAYRMLGYVNHEIRNPLNTIKNLTELTIEDINLSFNDNEHLSYIQSNLYTVINSSELLSYIVNDILDIQKLEQGKLLLQYENVQISKLLSDIYKIIRNKLSENPNLEYIVNVDDEEIYIYIPVIRIKQILINFLTNAIKFTENGTLELSIVSDDKNYIFSVTDTGRGIPEKNKKYIFHPFEQIRKEDSTRYGGVGLGLYLCKLMVDNMNGKIGFESKEGQGSKFWISIPILKNNNNESV